MSTRGKRGTEIAQSTGAPVVLTTTTAEEVFADDEARFSSIFMDASRKQTRAILLARAQHFKVTPATDLPLWQTAMSLLIYKKGY